LPNQLNLNLASGKASKKLGYHLTRLRGRGMSFAESRSYQPGDEIRHIDWRVTARTGITHTKTFEEERDRPVFIFVDQSASMFIGSTRCFKAYLAAELAVQLGWLACRAQDRFGGAFVGQDYQYTPLKSGRQHWGHFCQSILDANQSWDLHHDQAKIEWPIALKALKRDIKPGSLIIIISDFFEHQIQSQDLHHLCSHGNILCIGIEDPIEASPPEINGLIGFAGQQWFYRGQGDDRRRLKKYNHERWQQMKTMCAEFGVGFFTANTDKTALENLEAILR